MVAQVNIGALPIAVCETPYAWRIKQSVGTAGSAEDAVTSTTAVCRSCGAVPHEGARFCQACGSLLLAALDAAEYKQVTVLFADVVRSMDIAAALDIERLREIMTELVNRCAAVVLRYGGTVDKFTGDGIMALFGGRWRWRTTPCGRVWRRWTSSKKLVASPPTSSAVMAWPYGCGSG
jgi:hypothetical protein